MKVIILKKNSHEIGRLSPDKRVLLVGRAPICDLVLRKIEMKPIHFIVEWMGEGAFDPYQGLWSISDISQNTSPVKKDNYSGEAHILTSDSVVLGDFEVSLEEEKLAASPISKGVITRSLDVESEAKKASGLAVSEKVLELVTYNTDVDVVTSVNHFSREHLIRGVKISSLPNLNFNFNPNGNSLVMENQGETNLIDIYNRADRVIDNFKHTNDKLTIDTDDFYLVYSPENAYYVRWVNKHVAQSPPSAWKRDPVILTLIAVTLIMFGVGVLIRFVDPIKIVDIPKPARVATVEILVPEAAPVEVPPLPVYDQDVKKEELIEPPVEQPVVPPKVEAKPLEKPEDANKKVQNQPTDNVATKPKKTADLGKRATIKNVDDSPDLSQGLNQKGEIKNVNTVGLLGKLGGSKKVGTGISADAVMAKVTPVDSASGDSGKVQLLQPPTGKVNLTGSSKTMANDDDSGQGLSAATTTLKMDNMAKGSKISGIASSKATGSIGTGAFGGNEKDGSNSIQSLGSSMSLETKAMEVQGGLTKEQVRQAISDNRRALRNCHEQFLTYKKDLGGRLVLRWKIDGDGPVETISTQSTNTSYPNFDECVRDVIKKIVFPKAPNGNATVVIYPFLFQPKK